MNLAPPVAVALLIAAAFVRPAAAQPSPTLLVLNKIENTLAFVDPATGQITGKVPTGEGPHEVVTDGTRAYVSNYGAQTPGATLSVIDLASRKEVRRVDLGPLRRPHGHGDRRGEAVLHGGDQPGRRALRSGRRSCRLGDGHRADRHAHDRRPRRRRDLLHDQHRVRHRERPRPWREPAGVGGEHDRRRQRARGDRHLTRRRRVVGRALAGRRRVGHRHRIAHRHAHVRPSHEAIEPPQVHAGRHARARLGSRRRRPDRDRRGQRARK